MPYFQHDYDPTNDPKIIVLLAKYKAEGYGIFWRIVEMLHLQDTNKLPKKKFTYIAIAERLGVSVELVSNVIKYCIDPCELFVEDKNHFWSERATRNIERKNSIIELKIKAGKASALKRNSANNGEHVPNTSSTHVEHNPTQSNKLNKTKLNQIKLKEQHAAIFEILKANSPGLTDMVLHAESEKIIIYNNKNPIIDLEAFIPGWIDKIKIEPPTETPKEKMDRLDAINMAHHLEQKKRLNLT